MVASLEALDLPLEVFQPFSLEDTFSDILRMGELLDATARAEALVADMRQRIDAIQADTASAQRYLWSGGQSL